MRQQNGTPSTDRSYLLCHALHTFYFIHQFEYIMLTLSMVHMVEALALWLYVYLLRSTTCTCEKFKLLS